jgi:hypothetical protein
MDELTQMNQIYAQAVGTKQQSKYFDLQMLVNEYEEELEARDYKEQGKTT